MRVPMCVGCTGAGDTDASVCGLSGSVGGDVAGDARGRGGGAEPRGTPVPGSLVVWVSGAEDAPLPSPVDPLPLLLSCVSRPRSYVCVRIFLYECLFPFGAEHPVL